MPDMATPSGSRRSDGPGRTWRGRSAGATLRASYAVAPCWARRFRSLQMVPSKPIDSCSLRSLTFPLTSGDHRMGDGFGR